MSHRRVAVVFLFLCMGISGCATLPRAVEPIKSPFLGKKEKEFYIINHGWHTGLAIAAKDLNKVVPELSVRFPDSSYYEIGWGDSGFYQSNRITVRLTLQAMFWSRGSVLHVVGFSSNPAVQFKNSEVIALKTDEENYRNILRFVALSFKRNGKGEIIYENLGIYGDSQFYTAIGKYHIMNTCNKWTAKALYSAGYEIFPMFKLTSSSVMGSVFR